MNQTFLDHGVRSMTHDLSDRDRAQSPSFSHTCHTCMSNRQQRTARGKKSTNPCHNLQIAHFHMHKLKSLWPPVNPSPSIHPSIHLPIFNMLNDLQKSWRRSKDSGSIF